MGEDIVGDIKNAISAENIYKAQRANDPTLSLLDFLLEWGYKDLSEYFLAKTLYQIQQADVQIYETDMTDIANRVEEAFVGGQASIFIPTSNNVFVWHGSDFLDYDLCDKLCVSVYEMGYIGGTIVSGPEDLSLSILLPQTIDLNADYFLEKFAKFFSTKFEFVIRDNNDIMINNQKILGAMFRNGNGMKMFAAQVSFCDRTEIINQLCPSESGKVPGFIDSSVLSREELKNEVLSWL